MIRCERREAFGVLLDHCVGDGDEAADDFELTGLLIEGDASQIAFVQSEAADRANLCCF